VDLSEGASGGPFTGARILSVSQADAIKSDLAVDGGRVTLLVSTVGAYSGAVSLQYVLSNDSGESNPGVVEVEVRERPDPSLDAGVRGIINAQAQSATRFASAQLTNVDRRLEAIRSGLRASGNGVALAAANNVQDRVPGFDRSKARDREMLAAMSGRGGELDSAGTLAMPKSHKSRGKGDVSVWSSGVIELGRRKGASGDGGFDFNTSGLSVGADIQVAADLVVGAGVGAARDRSDIGNDGSSSEGRGYSAFVYGALRPTEGMFVNAILGVGGLEYDSRRWVSETGVMATGHRNGDQVFGSLSAGLDRQVDQLHLSPYGRLEFVRSRLASFSEQGDDTFALAFDERRVSQLSGIVGLKGDLRVEKDTGTLVPSMRAEYRWALSRSGVQGIRYADWADSPVYELTPGAYGDRRLTLGLGLNWLSISGWNFSGEVESAVADKAGSSTTVRVSGGGKF
jgi:outer membrane autotransporter protein